MYYIESPSFDAAFNLALEQYVFERLDPDEEYCMLWRNRRAVIVGKHQNTFAEVDSAYADERLVQVVRRLSGGGAVYHDLGNVNFTFIAKDGGDGSFDFATFCRPVVRLLRELGGEPELSGRNDMTVDGRKFSGNAQYMRRGRVMHHGTLMYDSDLEEVQRLLRVSEDKLTSKAITSVRSRVTNLKPYLTGVNSTEEFMALLRDFLFREYQLRPLGLGEIDWGEVTRMADERYRTWEWNYGESPAFSVVKKRRVEGCGTVEIHLDAKGGIITNLAFYGDYFGNGDPTKLAGMLTGVRLEREAVMAALNGVDTGHWFAGLDNQTFADILCG